MLSRKELSQTVNTVKRLKAQHKQLGKSLSGYGFDEAIQVVIETYENIIRQLEKKIEAMPVGHRYQGILY